MYIQVSCENCEYFIPDKIGLGDGIGECKVLEDYKLKNPSQYALEKAEKAIGGKLLYPKIKKQCSKFKKKRIEK